MPKCQQVNGKKSKVQVSVYGHMIYIYIYDCQTDLVTESVISNPAVRLSIGTELHINSIFSCSPCFTYRCYCMYPCQVSYPGQTNIVG